MRAVKAFGFLDLDEKSWFSSGHDLGNIIPKIKVGCAWVQINKKELEKIKKLTERADLKFIFI